MVIQQKQFVARMISVLYLFCCNSVMSTEAREESAPRPPNMHEHILLKYTAS